jgi:Fur family ferric uptake transcriptional regulator
MSSPVETKDNLAPVAQRQSAIAALIRELPRGTHLTAPEVYRRAQAAGLKVSLSSVYRTLNLLQAHGDVSAVAGDHGKRYEAREEGHDHDHLICVKCGLTIEFEDELIRGFGKTVAERKGYEHKSSRFDILGICQECKSKDQDRKVEVSAINLESAIESLRKVLDTLETGADLLDNRKITKAAAALETAVPPLKEALDQLHSSLSLLAQQSRQG